MKTSQLASFALSGLALTLFATSASAVGTRTFQLDSVDRLSGGESKGVAIGADGVLRPGFALGSAPIADAGSVMSVLTLADGSVLLGTAPSGKVYKVTGDQVSVYADTGALAVTSLAEAPGGGVLAATLPDGKIFKLAPGKATVFSTVKDASLWALAVTKEGIFCAGGGDKKGAIYKIESNGASSVYFQSEEQHLVSLAAYAGELFAGSSGKSVLYRIKGPGKGTVLADFPGQEVKNIVVRETTTAGTKKAVPQIYVTANDYPEPPEPPRRSSNVGRQAPGPSTAARPKPGKGALFRVDLTGRSEKLMSHGDTHYLALVVDDKGTAYVGAGVEGRVYSVDDAHAVSQVADTDERQIVGLALPAGSGSPKANGAESGKGTPYVAASDPVVFHRIKAPSGDEASWTSKVLDAQMPARFGTITFRGNGKMELASRSGNTKTPDTTWSDWSQAIRGPAKITSPSARYLQVRARFVGDPNATLSEITIPFVTENARAIVTEVSVDSKTFFTKEPASSIPSTGNEAPKQSSKMKLSWKTDNADSDALRYRIAFRKEGQLTWRDILRAEETYTKTDYDWDTSVLSEGRYRIKVEASDELANPPETTERHSLVSESFVVDNTPPVIEKAALEGGKLRVVAKDGVSPIARIEVAVDGRPDFRPLVATDGLFDSISEAAEGSVSLLAGTGRHLYFVRVVDGSGNATTREVEGP